MCLYFVDTLTFKIESILKAYSLVLHSSHQGSTMSLTLHDLPYLRVDTSLRPLTLHPPEPLSLPRHLLERLSLRLARGFSKLKHYLILVRNCWSLSLSLKPEPSLLSLHDHPSLPSFIPTSPTFTLQTPSPGPRAKLVFHHTSPSFPRSDNILSVNRHLLQ